MTQNAKPEAPMTCYYVDHALYARKLARAGYYDEAYDALSRAWDLLDEDLEIDGADFIDASHAYIKSLEDYNKAVA